MEDRRIKNEIKKLYPIIIGNNIIFFITYNLCVLELNEKK